MIDTARVAQPFIKVWTPRTPDSSYDSFGLIPPPPIIVMAPMLTESMGSSVLLEAASYWAQAIPTSSGDNTSTGLSLISVTYSPPPPPP